MHPFADSRDARLKIKLDSETSARLRSGTGIACSSAGSWGHLFRGMSDIGTVLLQHCSGRLGSAAGAALPCRSRQRLRLH